MFETLINAAHLAESIRDPGWRVLDCRAALGQPDHGARAYGQGHLPGALFADLDRDLAGPPGAGGRHPLPSREALADRFGRWGIGDATQVVAYDDDGGPYACRFWWLARWLGHRAVAVLDGGLGAWRDAGFDLTTDAPTPTPTTFHPRPPLTRTVDADAIRGDPNLVLLDARARERYAGEVEPIDFKAGHIPGALCAPFPENLGADGRFLPPAALRARFEAICPDPGAPLACYCGSGVTATHNVMSLVLAGYPEPALYPGSWSEWIRDPDRPTEP